MTAVLWLRRDLRVADHPALAGALAGGEPVVPVFCFDDGLLDGRHASGPRTQFMLECLQELDAALGERGSRLFVRRGHPAHELVAVSRAVGQLDAKLGHRLLQIGRFSAFQRQGISQFRQLLPGLVQLVAAAHKVCPYSHATRGNIDVALTVDRKRLYVAPTSA